MYHSSTIHSPYLYLQSCLVADGLWHNIVFTTVLTTIIVWQIDENKSISKSELLKGITWCCKDDTCSGDSVTWDRPLSRQQQTGHPMHLLLLKWDGYIRNARVGMRWTVSPCGVVNKVAASVFGQFSLDIFYIVRECVWSTLIRARCCRIGPFFPSLEN